MNYTVLGRTGLRVSSLCLGSAWFGVAPLGADVGGLVSAALDSGINFFDTASSYGNQSRFDRPGAPPAALRESAEELLGRALRGRRDDVVLATKVGERVGPGVNDAGVSRSHVERSLERSLRRLGTSYLDLYYVHHPDPGTGTDDLVETFGRLIDRGLIRHWALSNFTGWRSVDVHLTARSRGCEPPAAQQVYYNLVRRSAEQELLPALNRCGQAVIAYSGLAGGLLGGARSARRPQAGPARTGKPPYSNTQLAVGDRLQELADQAGCRPAGLALGWLLARPGVAATVVGPESARELADLVTAVRQPLSAELLSAVDAVTEPGVNRS
jgi:aryl-alcohol dehydrogenase-like predicted oxidoreductase